MVQLRLKLCYQTIRLVLRLKLFVKVNFFFTNREGRVREASRREGRKEKKEMLN